MGPLVTFCFCIPDRYTSFPCFWHEVLPVRSLESGRRSCLVALPGWRKISLFSHCLWLYESLWHMKNYNHQHWLHPVFFLPSRFYTEDGTSPDEIHCLSLLPPSSTFLLFPWSYGLLICVGRNVVVFEKSGKWWLRMDYWHRRGIVASFPWLWTLNFSPEGNKGTMEVIFVPPLCIFPFPGIQFNFFSPKKYSFSSCPELIWGWG